VDFHPWCWKHKKDKDGINKDKDFLTIWCMTPDCKAPISKVTIVKDDPETPVIITDEDLTAKMVAEGKMLVK
jgi:hypothetical protein